MNLTLNKHLVKCHILVYHLRDTDQCTSATANSNEARLDHASLALARRGRGPRAQQQWWGSRTSRGSQLLLLLLAESLDLLWRYRDGLTRRMRQMTRGGGALQTKGIGGEAGDVKSITAKGTHKERKAQREIISSK